MSLKQVDFDHRGNPVKKKGWFSWRHETAAEHTAAVEARNAVRGRAARVRRANERKAVAS